MLIIVTVSVLVLVCAYVLQNGRAFNDAPLSESRAATLTVGVQIICGDCSGDGERPLKTYLDRHGNCSQCGGHSYMLASSRIVYAQQLMAARLSVNRGERDSSDLQLFDVSLSA
ncbi:MAG TPA: hypothetical protein VIG62_22575 [Blastocatellia bacterium]|jgi:hypothetical protein